MRDAVCLQEHVSAVPTNANKEISEKPEPDDAVKGGGCDDGSADWLATRRRWVEGQLMREMQWAPSTASASCRRRRRPKTRKPPILANAAPEKWRIVNENCTCSARRAITLCVVAFTRSVWIPQNTAKNTNAVWRWVKVRVRVRIIIHTCR